LAARFGLPAAGALDAAESAGGVTMAAGTTTLFAARSPGAVEGGGAILVARALGLRAAGPPRALERAGVTVVAETTGFSGAGPPGGVEDGGIIPAGNIGLTGAGGGGINAVAGITGLYGAGPAGGIDGVGPFRRRAGISAAFSTGGAMLTSASAFGLGAVPLRRCFGLGAAARGAFAFPGLVFFLRPSLVGYDFPRRRTPGGSSQIHFTAPLPPSVRMKFLSSRRCISSITQRFV
jgi:hypothetical protein